MSYLELREPMYKNSELGIWKFAPEEFSKRYIRWELLEKGWDLLIEEVKEKFDGAEVKNVISFGKHNGKEWKDVPQDYVEWCAGGSKIEWQRDAANEELQRRSNNGDKPKDVTNTEVSKDELEDVPF